jgi:hypothetical protein
MNTFYYSFSARVARYEREQQPWLEAAVKARLYPLLGILKFAERTHFAVSSGEAGALASEGVASAMTMIIDAVYYLQPAISSKQLQRKFGTICKISIAILFIAMALTIVDMLTGSMQLLMTSTSLLVILLATVVSATTAGSLASRAYSKFASRRHC